MRCRICDSKLIRIFTNPKCPKYSHKYLMTARIDESILAHRNANGVPIAQDKDATYELNVGKCSFCNTIQLEDDLPSEDYSDDYQRNISFSYQAKVHAEEWAVRLSLHKPTSFIEIGCGNGLFSGYMKRMNPDMKQIAFEPSNAAYQKAIDSGLKVINAFYDKDAPSAEYGYDSFAIRFVLEHLPNPAELLGLLMYQCRDGAVGLIEVPNAEKQMREGRWFEFFREHTFYFTGETLTRLVENAGFEVLDMRKTQDEEFITMLVRAGSWKEMEIKDLNFNHKTYAFGASGGAATWLANTSGISMMIDNDVNKHDMILSGSRIPIVGPQMIVDSPPDTIVITASGFKKEIHNQIRSLGYKGRIVVYPNLEEME
jgi:2-polyprenyl-3-methyl-5-hydroxy-6-metoxy-1,4-benzoquinol methylase